MASTTTDISSFTPAQTAAFAAAAKLAPPGSVQTSNGTPSYAPGTPQNTPTPATVPTYQTPQATNTPGTTGYNPSGGVPLPTTSTSPIQPPLQPQTEDQIYGNYVTQGQSIIDQINAASQAQINAANQQIDQAASKSQQDNNALAAISGNFGSASVSGSSAIASDAATKKNTADTAISSQSQQQIATYLQNLQTAAQNEASYEQSTGFSQGITYDQYLKTTAATTLQGLSKTGVSLQQLQTQAQAGNPVAQQTMQTLLQAYGGDQNALAAAAAIATPVDSVVQSWTQGSTYNQVVRDPNTNAISVQSFDLGVQVPTGWTSNKVSTTTLMMQDPNNPANSVIYSTDPLTGNVTVSGTGTGQAIASQYNSQNTTTPTNSTSTSTPSATGGTYTQTVSNALGGIDLTTPLTSVVTQNGLGPITNAIITAEGGSLPGVSNNPGNVKYAGLPGQTDSGVKATDGGTFASYATPDAGQKAIASIINDAASGTSSAYGASPTLQSFLEKYANLPGTGSSTNTSSNGLSSAEYGKLSTVAGFNPTTPGLDQDALKYLRGYLSGTQPTAASLGISTRSGQGGALDQVSQRANDVYFKATNQQLPDIMTLKGNLALVNKNNALLNNLGVQTGVITKNFGLNLQNLSENNVNQAAPVINQLADYLQQASGSTSVAQYLTQNATLQQEIGGLLSIKNASGVTVADKIAAGDLLPSDLSADQQKQILSTFIKEAKNQQQSIGNANATLYQQTDPLGLDPQNPINQPGYQTLTTSGFTPNYDGTYDAPDGTTWKVDSQGNATQIQ